MILQLILSDTWTQKIEEILYDIWSSDHRFTLMYIVISMYSYVYYFLSSIVLIALAGVRIVINVKWTSNY